MIHKCCSRRRLRNQSVSEKHAREKNTHVFFSSERVGRHNRTAQREIHIEEIPNFFFTKQYQGKKTQCKNLKFKAQSLFKTYSIVCIIYRITCRHIQQTVGLLPSALSVLIHLSFLTDRPILWSFLQVNFLFVGSYTTRGYV